MKLSPAQYRQLVDETATAQLAALDAAQDYDAWEAARDRFAPVWRELAAIKPQQEKNENRY